MVLFKGLGVVYGCGDGGGLGEARWYLAYWLGFQGYFF
jgi:hypothetical protein